MGSGYGPKIYREQGAERFVIASGGSADVESGGEIDVESGGALKIAAVQVLGTGREIGRPRVPAALAANAALTVAGDSGNLILIGAVDLVITLPATAAGARFTFLLQAAGLSIGTGLSISPAAADAIHDNGLTSVDDKDLILAGASDREGDMVELVGDGIDGWYITAISGTWSKQA